MSKSIKHLSLSVAAGIALGFSWPINGLTFLIFISLIPLLYLEESIRKDNLKFKSIRAFGYSYLSFLIWNLITTWWLFNSTLFGMLFANLCNSLFYALIFVVFYWDISCAAHPRPHVARPAGKRGHPGQAAARPTQHPAN